MITAVFYKKSGSLTGFKVSGHAGYADAGEDVVCASVSSAVQLTANLITENFGIKSDIVVDENAVTLKVVEIGEEAGRILDGFKTHLELVSKEFKNTIIIKISEV